MSNASENQTIGPYRVIGSLGKGGMGEVLLAKDPRLHRKVAIKQIRGGEHPEARQRFQREARLAASLSHASIVSIFDFVEQEDHEYLVMELVDGPSLKAWLEGEVSFEEKLRVAEQIAAGLQYAHRFGVVHRDLKTENVLITPEGQAKIADFGIARRFRATDEMAGDETADANTRDRTELLTREGALIGTYRSMSPEQAQGERADFRSDLFSFGVLLYEMFAGVSPFLADKPLDTLFNLVSRPHPDLDQVAPGLPRPLVRLIDQLLEKDRDLRPRSADEVLQQLRQVRRAVEEESGATLGTTGTLGSGALKVPLEGRRLPGGKLAVAAVLLLLMMLSAWRMIGRNPVTEEPLQGGAVQNLEPAPVVVGVLPVTGFEKAELLDAIKNRSSFLIRDSVREELGAIEGYVPIGTGEVDEVLKEGLRGKPEIAAALGADELVEPQVSCDGYKCVIQLQRWRADGSEIWTPPRQKDLPMDNLAPVSLVVKMLTTQEFGAEKSGVADVVQGREIPIEDREELLGVRIALHEGLSNSDLNSSYEKLEELRQKERFWLDPLLLQIDLKLALYGKTQLKVHLDAARKCMNDALQLAPDQLSPLLLAVHIEVMSGELSKAKDYLEEANQREPLDTRVIDLQALVLEQEGRLKEALAQRKAAYDRWPSWIRTLAQARTYMKLSQWKEAREVLAPLLEQAPEYRRALALRAELELTVGEVDQAVPLYRNLSAKYNESIYAVNLALALYLAGNGEEALAVAKRELEKGQENPFLLLLYADAARLAGKGKEADEIYLKISTLDFPGTTSWQIYSLLAQAHARLDARSEKATEYIDKAYELARSDSGFDVDAALVYTLLGDAARAKRYIEKVYQAGKMGWLRQPEFERWRNHTEIQRLLPPKKTH